MEWTPTDRADVMNVTIPLGGKAEEAIGDPPSDKVTVPVGVQPYCAVTVTVNVTIC